MEHLPPCNGFHFSPCHIFVLGSFSGNEEFQLNVTGSGWCWDWPAGGGNRADEEDSALPALGGFC